MLFLGVDMKSGHFSKVFDLVVEERFQELAGNSVPHRYEALASLQLVCDLVMQTTAFRAIDAVVGALVSSAQRKSAGAWHKRLYKNGR